MPESLTATVRINEPLVPRSYSGGTFWRVHTDKGEFVLFEAPLAPVLKHTGVYEISYRADRMGRNMGSIQSATVVEEPAEGTPDTVLTAPAEQSRPPAKKNFSDKREESITRMSCLKTAAEVMSAYKEMFGTPALMLSATLKAAHILADYAEGRKTSGEASDAILGLTEQVDPVASPPYSAVRRALKPVAKKPVPVPAPKAEPEPIPPTPTASADDGSSDQSDLDALAEQAGMVEEIPAAFAPHDPPPKKQPRRAAEPVAVAPVGAAMDEARKLNNSEEFADRMRSRLLQLRGSQEDASPPEAPVLPA